MRVKTMLNLALRAFVLGVVCFGIVACGEERPKFDFRDLPKARNRWSTNPIPAMLVEFHRVPQAYYLGDERIPSIESLIEKIDSRVSDLYEEYNSAVTVYFCFPKNYSAASFSRICRETPGLISEKGQAYLYSRDAMDDELGADEEATTPNVLILDQIVSNQNELKIQGESYVETLVIGRDSYGWGDENIESWEILHSEIWTLLAASKLMDATPVLRIIIGPDVSMQRLVSALDFRGIRDISIIFEEPLTEDVNSK